MNRQNSIESVVGLVLGLAVAILVAVVVHYVLRGRDWWRYCGDDPELYALTQQENTMFVIGAWAFPLETALVAAGFLALALSAHPGFALGTVAFGGVLGLSLALLSRRDADLSRDGDDDDLYDLELEE